MKRVRYYTEKSVYGLRLELDDKKKQWHGFLQTDPFITQNNDSDPIPIMKSPIEFV